MKKNFKKTIAILISAVIIVCMLTVSSFAAKAKLTYKVTEFGTAELISCNKDADGAVTVPSQVTIGGKKYDVQAIGDNAFEGCTKITKITISEGVKIIGSKAFASCDKLKTVDIPASLLTCAYDAFADCSEVTVNCYKTNYQFFTVTGFSGNIKINIIDGGLDETQTEQVNSIIDFIRKIITMILSFFGINK